MEAIQTLLLYLSPSIDSTTLRQLNIVCTSMLSMTARVTMLGISRWAALTHDSGRACNIRCKIFSIPANLAQNRPRTVIFTLIYFDKLRNQGNQLRW
jgi:hypothetical protein